uniref:Uncharacterized protein n=1 Tax=Romanomermis culicivorax TaxID=13658 RepID=A0A915HQI6_ROMCU
MNDVALLGLKDQALQKWDDLFNLITTPFMDQYDFAAFKYIILLNPAYINQHTTSKSIVAKSRNEIKNSWIDYRKDFFIDPDAHLTRCTELIRFDTLMII